MVGSAIAVQYIHWLSNALRGDLGISIMFRDPMIDMFAVRLPITLYLSGIALVLSTLFGIAAGIICAIRRGGILDQLVSLSANVGIAIPVFWLGILGVYVLGYRLRMAAHSGMDIAIRRFYGEFEMYR